MASDLHTHTNFSDGSFSPEELVAAAKEVGLSYLGVTDHDTVDGVRYLYENGLYSAGNLKIIPGVELSANDPEHDIHIVGYNVDIYNGNLIDMINEILEEIKPDAEAEARAHREYLDNLTLTSADVERAIYKALKIDPNFDVRNLKGHRNNLLQKSIEFADGVLKL